jgi:acetyl esterase/lipase
MLHIPDDVLLEARTFYEAKTSRQPRLNFMSKTQIMLVRTIMAVAALVSPSPLKKFGVSGRNTSVSAEGRSVKIRLIEPTKQPKGIVVDIHGGAWTVMRPVQDDPLTGPIAAEGYIVVSADYRYAPANPFEEVIRDCETALAWALSKGCEQYGLNQVFLHGDSAGAHLAMAAALRCQSAPGFGRLRGLVLFFGAFDLSGTPSVRNAPEETLFLRGPSLARYFARVTGNLSEAERRNPSISPLYADLSALPPALIIVGTADPMIDDSLQLADKFRHDGGEAELLVVPDAPHAFNRFPIRLADLVNSYGRLWMSSRTTASKIS